MAVTGGAAVVGRLRAWGSEAGRGDAFFAFGFRIPGFPAGMTGRAGSHLTNRIPFGALEITGGGSWPNLTREFQRKTCD